MLLLIIHSVYRENDPVLVTERLSDGADEQRKCKHRKRSEAQRSKSCEVRLLFESDHNAGSMRRNH